MRGARRGSERPARAGPIHPPLNRGQSELLLPSPWGWCHRRATAGVRDASCRWGRGEDSGDGRRGSLCVRKENLAKEQERSSQPAAGSAPRDGADVRRRAAGSEGPPAQTLPGGATPLRATLTPSPRPPPVPQPRGGQDLCPPPLVAPRPRSPGWRRGWSRGINQRRAGGGTGGERLTASFILGVKRV